MSTKYEVPPPADATGGVTRWLASLSTGAPLAHERLTLVPLYATGGTPDGGSGGAVLDYLVLGDALARGAATVTETPSARVPTLRVDNRGKLPVLIVDGEEVVGGLQNRVVNSSLLVPPLTVFDLPVTCVEHGRWRPESGGDAFAPGEAAYPALRAQKSVHVTAAYAALGAPVADQGAVWDAIAARHAADGTRSATGAMRDAYRSRDADLARAVARLRYPDDDPVGVVALAPAGVLCADVFDRPATLRAYWTRLVRSYVLDAAGPGGSSAGAAGDRGSPEAAAAALLARGADAAMDAYPSPGLGSDVRLRGAATGAALVHLGVPVHTALFPATGSAAGAAPAGRVGTIRRPAERRLRRSEA
jgi:hypothetical protein